MSTQKNETTDPEIVKRILLSTNLNPEPTEKIFNDEKSLATINGEDKDVTIHIDLSRELWNIVTSIAYTRHRRFIYEYVKSYLENKLAEAVEQDIRKISELGLFALPDSMIEEDC